MADKTVVRTEAAPAPFQGAPYSQAIAPASFVFVSGQLALKPGDKELSGGTIEEQTEQVFANLRAILEAAGSGLDRLVKTTVFLQNLDDFQGMNAVYAQHVGERPPARSTVEVAELPSGALVEIEAIAHRLSARAAELEDYVRSLGLDAYLVGGAVRDELLGLESKDADFLVPGVDTEELRRAARAARPRRGARRRRPARRRAPLPARRERAAARAARDRVRAAARGGEHRAGPARFRDRRRRVGPVEDDMRRRDFTVNAMARRLADGELVDPFGGQEDLDDRVLRAVSPTSFAEDPLRTRARRCASSRSSTSTPDDETLAQMRDEAPYVRLVSGERIGGGLRRTAWASCRSCCSAASPRRRCGSRATPACSCDDPRVRAAIGFDQESRYQRLTRRRAHFAVVRRCRRRRALPRASRGAVPRSRQAARWRTCW